MSNNYSTNSETKYRPFSRGVAIAYVMHYSRCENSAWLAKGVQANNLTKQVFLRF